MSFSYSRRPTPSVTSSVIADSSTSALTGNSIQSLYKEGWMLRLCFITCISKHEYGVDFREKGEGKEGATHTSFTCESSQIKEQRRKC